MTNRNCCQWNLDFINVGYGDSILISTRQGEGHALLVDCGDIPSRIEPDRGMRTTALAFLRDKGVHALDAIWLTHLHLDHVGGLEELANSLPVAELITGYLPPESLIGRQAPLPKGANDGVTCLLTALNIYSRSLQALMEAGARPLLVAPETGCAPLRFEGLTLTPYCAPNPLGFQFMQGCFDQALRGDPDEDALSRLDVTINDLSVGLRAEGTRKTAELPGDLGLEPCKAILASRCNVFKMPHHGHRLSVDAELMERLKPELTVISVSDNRLDACPHFESVRLAEAGSGKVCFTDSVVWNGRSREHKSVPFCL